MNIIANEEYFINPNCKEIRCIVNNLKSDYSNDEYKGEPRDQGIKRPSNDLMMSEEYRYMKNILNSWRGLI